MKCILAGLCAACLLVSCSENSETADLHLSNAEFTWDATVREQSLAVATPSRWTMKSDVNWCVPWKSTGTSGEQVKLWVSPNLTSTARTGTLTVSSGGSVKFVKLTQPAFTGDVDGYEYVLPVVFHVFYADSTDEQQYVRKGWLAQLLTKVNSLYRSNNIGVTFEMAACTQDGEELEEPGVMRHRITSESFDPQAFIAGKGEAKELAKYQQNLRRFINVHVFRFSHKDDGDGSWSLGITNMPYTTTAHPLDSLHAMPGIENYTHISTPWGVCINNEAIYSLSERTVHRTNDVSVTLAHELGHYLGLLHTFSEVGCSEDDACSDTPICDYTAYREQVERMIDDYIRFYGEDYQRRLTLEQLALRENCLEAGKTYTANKVMDYNYCLSNKLTPQQRMRIRHVLNYVPLVPGPKLVDYSTKTTRSASEIKPVPSRCPTLPARPLSVAP